MAILNYFKWLEAKKSKIIYTVLPKSDGPLANSMPNSAVEAANKGVRATLLESPSVPTKKDGDNADSGKKCRGSYQLFTPKERAGLGKRAAECGITFTIQYITKVDGQELFTWKEQDLRELANRKHNEDPEVKQLPPKKRGCPLLIGAEVDARVQLYTKEMQRNRVVIDTSLLMAAAEGIVTHHETNLLAKNGGPIVISKH